MATLQSVRKIFPKLNNRIIKISTLYSKTAFEITCGIARIEHKTEKSRIMNNTMRDSSTHRPC